MCKVSKSYNNRTTFVKDLTLNINFIKICNKFKTVENLINKGI